MVSTPNSVGNDTMQTHKKPWPLVGQQLLRVLGVLDLVCLVLEVGVEVRNTSCSWFKTCQSRDGRTRHE